MNQPVCIGVGVGAGKLCRFLATDHLHRYNFTVDASEATCTACLVALDVLQNLPKLKTHRLFVDHRGAFSSRKHAWKPKHRRALKRVATYNISSIRANSTEPALAQLIASMRSHQHEMPLGEGSR